MPVCARALRPVTYKSSIGCVRGMSMAGATPESVAVLLAALVVQPFRDLGQEAFGHNVWTVAMAGSLALGVRGGFLRLRGGSCSGKAVECLETR